MAEPSFVLYCWVPLPCIFGKLKRLAPSRFGYAKQPNYYKVNEKAYQEVLTLVVRKITIKTAKIVRKVLRNTGPFCFMFYLHQMAP